jgi:hypothetical protein
MLRTGNKALSSVFISVCFAIMIAGTLGVTWMHFQSYTSLETPYVVSPLSPEVIKSFGGHPGIVHVGLIIEKFHTFQIMENKFIFDGVLWFRFDPKLVSLETINNIRVKNGKFLDKSPPHVRLFNEDLFVRYAVQIEFQCDLHFGDFPDDDHKIYIILTHSGVSPNSLVFESTRPDLLILDDLEHQGWKEFNRDVAAGYSSSRIQSSVTDVEFSNPVVVFAIDYRHNTMRNFLNIIIPLLVMLGIILFSFAVDREKLWKYRLTACMQAIAASVAFRFVIDSMSPKVGYAMASDKFFFMFLSFYLIMFIVALNTQRTKVIWERLIILAITFAVVGGTIFIWSAG